LLNEQMWNTQVIFFVQQYKKFVSKFAWSSYSSSGDLKTLVTSRTYCMQSQHHNVCWCCPSHKTQSLWLFVVGQQLSTPIL